MAKVIRDFNDIGRQRKATMNQINILLKGLSMNKVSRAFGYLVYHPEKGNPLEELIGLIRQIEQIDFTFENLSSEIPRAKEAALDILGKASRIKELIELIPEEHAQFASEALKALDMMYIRVLGDQLERLTFEGTDLEHWLKRIQNDQSLKDKCFLYKVKLAILHKGLSIQEIQNIINTVSEYGNYKSISTVR